MTKKSREEIISSILNFLDEKPLSIQQISERVGSNWVTINDVIEELKKEGKVREIVATDKIKIIKRTDYPVFYGAPIRKEYKEQTLFIASEIVKEWKKQKNGEIPLNTTLQKTAVEIIRNNNLNLPVLPLHYGLVTAIAIKPEEQINKDYEWKGRPEKNIIIKSIKEEISKHKNKASDEEDAQYIKYDLKLFQIRKEIIGLFKQGEKVDIKKLGEKLSKFNFMLPTDNLDIYSIFDKFIYSCNIIFMSREPKKSLNEIRETFDVLWDLITTTLFLKDSIKFVSPEDLQLFELIKSFHINSKMCTSDERVSNLESIADSINPEDIDIPMDEESIEIRRILIEGIERE